MLIILAAIAIAVLAAFGLLRPFLRLLLSLLKIGLVALAIAIVVAMFAGAASLGEPMLFGFGAFVVVMIGSLFWLFSRSEVSDAVPFTESLRETVHLKRDPREKLHSIREVERAWKAAKRLVVDGANLLAEDHRACTKVMAEAEKNSLPALKAASDEIRRKTPKVVEQTERLLKEVDETEALEHRMRLYDSLHHLGGVARDALDQLRESMRAELSGTHEAISARR